MSTSKISIFSEIGSVVTAENIRSQLSYIDDATPLIVEINSEGGSVSEAVAIYNLLRTWKGGVTVEIVGWALSAATVIAMAGQRIKAHATSLIMVHAPWTNASGNAGAMRENAALLDQVALTMQAAYARTRQPAKTLAAWMDGQDHWFTAQEALALGLVDEIISADARAAAPANVLACRHPIPLNFQTRISAMTITNTTPDAEQIRAEAIRADGERRQSIRYSFAKFSSREGIEAVQRACEDDHQCTAAAAGLKLLAFLGKDASSVNGWNIVNPNDGFSYNGNSTGPRMPDFKAAAVDVLLERAGIRVAKPHPQAADLRRTSIVGMAERILSMHGKSSVGMSKGQVIKAAMSTDDFPQLLSDLTGKAMRVGYNSAPATHAGWTGEREVSNFKKQTLAMLSEAPGLEQVPEGGEYRFGAYAESAESFTVKTYGKMVRFTRQALINDELGALTSIPSTQGAAARRLEADLVYGKLTSNPVMSDGLQLFHAGHSNLAAAGAALSVESLGASRAAMRKQKGINGSEHIDPQPRYLLVPVTLETKAEALLNSTVDPSRNNNSENPDWIRRLTLVADPRLDSNSEAAWYLATDPAQMEGIVRAYLEGEQRPFLEEQEGWKTDTTDYKVRLDVGVGVIDYRGLYKNPGA
ncbi:ClpP-like prohead protease/major capsid protein fusion protein [Polaromonas naphthalenivorans]|uniref:ATP-dependent Clp protease proteolytic subunit n=1 Tax=Polaromonas naphthalenivorans (strain CJ2) TaxID=365044 RepID=A1VKV0_POLNA|nr:ClpP-like prohead protease/major capsid protein fusion protein [Polaromonas naphthalenivorans]ABM36278.1 ATP-dependent Clp protease proteolytic subunit ClpP [Polaromonas naphthalenivorans CJ2]